MKKAILLRSTLITLVSLLLFAAVSVGLIGYYNRENVEKELQRVMTMAEASLAASGDPEEVAAMGTPVWDIRITVIDLSGDVLAESNPPDGNDEGLANHLDRAEVQAALAGKEKVVKRKSPTLGVTMCYLARRTAWGEGECVLRVAIPASRVDRAVTGVVVTMIVLAACVCALSVPLAGSLYRRTLRPYDLIKKGLRNINNGAYAEIVPRFRDEDLNETLTEINAFSERIRATLSENAREKEKLDYILNNMGQGLIVVNAAHTVLLANRRAADAFGAGEVPVGCNALYLTGEPRFLQAVDEAVSTGASAAFDYEGGGGVYAVRVEPLAAAWAAGEGYVAVIALQDVTEVRGAERVRSEFFANASHELKTPLTSIKGNAELLYNDMVPDEEKRKRCTGRIVQDSDRMLLLIDDMLKLSRLEEGTATGEVCEVDLADAAARVAADLAVQAERAGVSLSTELAPAAISASREDAEELISNLVSNAIKYNVEGGSVRVAVREENGRACLTVADTGIGIPPEHQARIFERFYRVDKGRSRASGGTGLGLAIVKHIAALYGAEITLASEPGKGTAITVRF